METGQPRFSALVRRRFRTGHSWRGVSLRSLSFVCRGATSGTLAEKTGQCRRLEEEYPGQDRHVHLWCS